MSDPTAVDLVPADSIEPEVAPAPADALPDLSGLAVIEAELGDVERALQRLDDGTYGTCAVCSTPIADEQLDAAPASLRCTEHASA